MQSIDDIADLLIARGCEPRMAHVLLRMAATSMSKGEDYSPGDDSYTNVRASEAFGMPGWVGAAIRINDKLARLQGLAREGKGSFNHESADDNALDIAVYGAIMLILMGEDAEKEKIPAGPTALERASEEARRRMADRGGILLGGQLRRVEDDYITLTNETEPVHHAAARR